MLSFNVSCLIVFSSALQQLVGNKMQKFPPQANELQILRNKRGLQVLDLLCAIKCSSMLQYFISVSVHCRSDHDIPIYPAGFPAAFRVRLMGHYTQLIVIYLPAVLSATAVHWMNVWPLSNFHFYCYQKSCMAIFADLINSATPQLALARKLFGHRCDFMWHHLNSTNVWCSFTHLHVVQNLDDRTWFIYCTFLETLLLVLGKLGETGYC